MPRPASRVRSIHADRVVLSVNMADPAHQRAEGHYIDITEAGGVRLRPWSIRWATPVQLDGMAHRRASAPGGRWAAFDGAPFGADEHAPRERLPQGPGHTQIPTPVRPSNTDWS